MSRSPIPARVRALAVLLAPVLVAPACLLPAPASAGERVFVGPYGDRLVHIYGRDGGYGFADAAVSGAYLGAPHARFPRPSDLVPPAQGSGTFGVPTVAGIRQAPASQPVVYVLAGAPRRPPARARVLSRGDGDGSFEDAGDGRGSAGAARIVSVDVPRR